MDRDSVERVTPDPVSPRSERGKKVSDPSFERSTMAEILDAIQDQYHPDRNPNGAVQMAVAENNAMKPIVAKKLNKIRKEPLPEWVYGYFSDETNKFLPALATLFERTFMRP